MVRPTGYNALPGRTAHGVPKWSKPEIRETIKHYFEDVEQLIEYHEVDSDENKKRAAMGIEYAT